MSPEMVVPWLVLAKGVYEALRPIGEGMAKRIRARRAARARKKPC